MIDHGPIELLDHRGDPDARSVLEDLTISRGGRPTRLGLALSIIAADADADADAADADDDDADADAADDDDADAADADDDDDDADADDAADDAAADAAAADAAADAADISRAAFFTSLLLGDIDMFNGIKLVAFSGGYYGRSIVRVGWMRRIQGDEWELIGGRVVTRKGAADRGALDRISVHGPGKTHLLSKQSDSSEPVHRLVPRRILNCNIDAWIDHCPKPSDWSDSE